MSALAVVVVDVSLLPSLSPPTTEEEEVEEDGRANGFKGSKLDPGPTPCPPLRKR